MKPSITLRIPWLLSVVFILAACSGIPLKERQMEKRDRYHEYAGASVESITHLGLFDGWTPIDKYELVVWTNINDAYLITVEPPCEDILFADRIRITKTGSTMYQKFDFVEVDRWKCRIESIQPVDYLQMKKDAAENAEKKEATKKN
ncbi:MAG: hypothetical protein JW925_05520 [Syntrophaceae bacterium]|nr:hypothetical protein [Syntrophaceae bacterium]